MKKISQLKSTDGTWHLALIDREGEGATLLRVACWAVVSEPGTDDRVVPMVVNPDAEAFGSELVFFDEDSEDVLGIVPPGEEINGSWDEFARSRINAVAELEEREEREENAKKLAAIVSSNDAALLRSIRDANRSGATPHALEELTASCDHSRLAALTERGLVATHRFSSSDLRHQWIVTPLGAELLLRLDKQ